jgi:DNA polymerase III delta subunit
MTARVRQEAERAGKEIEPRAAALLADMNPDGPAALASELAKLVAHVGERRRIEVADVEAVAVSTAGGNKYTFVDLVGMGRRDEALAELHALLEDGESPLYLVTLLAQHFLLLGGIRACEARGIRSPEAIAQALRKPAWILTTKKNFQIRGYEPPREQARRYDRAAIDRWLAGLLELDLALKSSRLPPAALMEEWILRLMSVAPAAA